MVLNKLLGLFYIFFKEMDTTTTEIIIVRWEKITVITHNYYLEPPNLPVRNYFLQIESIRNGTAVLEITGQEGVDWCLMSNEQPTYNIPRYSLIPPRILIYFVI